MPFHQHFASFGQSSHRNHCHEYKRKFPTKGYLPHILCVLFLAALLPHANAVNKDVEIENDLAALDAYAVGDFERASELWLEIVRERASSEYSIEPILYLLQIVEPYTSSAQELRHMYREESVSFSEDNVRHFRKTLLDLSARLGDVDLATEIAESLGTVRNWEWFLGPFSTMNIVDLQEPFPPEKDLNADSYQNWLGTVSRQLTGLSADGFIDFDSSFEPKEGAAYAAAFFHADGSGTTTLEFHTRTSYRIWWNGRMVLDKDSFGTDKTSRTTIPVEVKEGTNWLLVKAVKRSDSWQFRTLLDGLGDWIEPEPPIQRIALHPDNKSFLETRIPSKWSAPDSSCLPSGESSQWLAGVYRAIVDVRLGDYRGAEETLKTLLASDPDSSFLYGLLADTYYLWSDQQKTSETRLQNRAADMYRMALTVDPVNISSAVALAQIYLSRDNVSEALQLLKPLSGLAPDLAVSYYLQNALASAYGRKDFKVEQEEALLGALKSPGSLSQAALVRLVGLWREQNTLEKADLYIPEIPQDIDLSIGSSYRALLPIHPDGSEGRLILQKRALAFHPFDRSLNMAFGDDLMAAQLWDKAESAYRTACDICPQDHEPWEALADLALRKAQSANAVEANLDSILAFLDQALQRRNISRIRQKKDFLLEQYRGRSADPGMLKAYDVSLEDVTQEGIPWDEFALSSVVYLVDSAVVRFDLNGTREILTHQAAQITKQRAIDEWAEIAIPGDPEDTRILSARTISPRGEEFLPLQITSMEKARALSMYGVEVGSIVEFSHVSERMKPEAPPDCYYSESFYFGAIEDAMVVSRYVVLVPDGMAFHYEAHPPDFEPLVERVPAERTKNKHPYTAYIWERRNIRGLRNETQTPSMHELVHSVRVSTCPDFQTEILHAESLLADRRTDSEEIEAHALSLAETDSPLDLKIASVYNWIQEHIRLTSSAGRTDLDVLEMLQGSALERGILALSLLKVLRVPSHIDFVLDRSDFTHLPPLPNASRFGASIVALPSNDVAPKYLDFSSKHYAPYETSPEVLNSIVLTADDHGYQFQPADPTIVNTGWVARNLDFHLISPGVTAVSGSLTYEGMFRPIMRRMLEDKRMAERIVDQQVASQLANLTIEAITAEAVPGQPPRISFSGTMPDFLHPVVLSAPSDSTAPFSFYPVLDRAEASDLVQEATRENKIRFSNWASLMPYEAVFRLGELSDYAFAQFPEDCVLQSKYGTYSLTYRPEGDILYVRRSLLIPPQDIEPREYDRFIRFCRDIDDAERRKIVIGKYQLTNPEGK